MSADAGELDVEAASAWFETSICTRLLSKAGFSVESVGNGYEALEALERKRFDRRRRGSGHPPS
jgi:hypothetical protein